MSSSQELAPGATLKHWKIERKLGDGGCGQVYLASNVKSGGEKVALKVARVPVIDKSTSKSSKKRKKTDAERAADSLYAEHMLYQTALKGCSGIPKCPHGAYGEDQGYRFFAMQLLGPDLDEFCQQNKPISPAVVSDIGCQLLDTLQTLHTRKIIFVDIKPANFMFGLPRTPHEKEVFVIDFGLSERYMSYKGEHKTFKSQTVVGSPTYLSISTLRGDTPSRKDDIEGLGYVLVYLLRGDLPWEQARSNEESLRLKQSISLDELCSGLPDEMREFISIAREYEFDEEPDYSRLRQLLVSIGIGSGAVRARKPEPVKRARQQQQQTSDRTDEAPPQAEKDISKKKKKKVAPAEGRKSKRSALVERSQAKTTETADVSALESEEEEKAEHIDEVIQTPAKKKRVKRKEVVPTVDVTKENVISPRTRVKRTAARVAEARLAAQQASHYAAVAAAAAFSPPEKSPPPRKRKSARS